MSSRRGASARSGEIQVHTAAPWDPRFKNHTQDGTPVASGYQELRDYAARVNEEEGRSIRVNPDGGPPTGADLANSRVADRQRHQQDRIDRGAASRAAQAERRRG
ncbi:MAG: hypothetical protein GXP62_11575 [Oligoflexia bacterium]|nr:hypothetical protein [Oligoflexia bacterium]